MAFLGAMHIKIKLYTEIDCINFDIIIAFIFICTTFLFPKTFMSSLLIQYTFQFVYEAQLMKWIKLCWVVGTLAKRETNTGR